MGKAKPVRSMFGSSQCASSAFDSTHWSFVEDLQADKGERRRAAMERLCRIYWPPIYAFLRRSGLGSDEALDVTQAYFEVVVLSRHLFESAQQDRGRLRTLILASLRRFAIDQSRQASVKHDKNRVPWGNLSQEEFLLRTTDETPEHAFERRWAGAVLEEALRRCQEYFVRRDMHKHWHVFEARVVQPVLPGGVEPPSLASLATELGFPSAQAVASALYLVRKRQATLLREVILETVADPARAEEEYNQLLQLAR